jgi:aspartate/methionine/tyrosine aminotransferase
MNYAEMTKEQLEQEYQAQKKLYQEYQAQQKQYDMTRGKPSSEQLDLSLPMLAQEYIGDAKSENGLDCRNYGLVDGLPEAKRLMGELLGVKPQCVMVGGNASLNLMYDIVVRFLLLGTGNERTPWNKASKAVRFLCPAPGYDRHFAICEQLGIEMLTLDLGNDGPNMDEVETLVFQDASIKGMWAVPKYGNPTGVVYSDEVIRRLANMKCAADDFRIFWDDAYTVHALEGEPVRQQNIIDACAEAGNPDRALAFTSTSKITFPGAGISAVASSQANIEYLVKTASIQTIGPDKLNQLRHLRFLKDYNNVVMHVKKHAALIKPKFDLILNLFETELGKANILEWTKPKGGYFISINTLDGCAARVVQVARECGLLLTPAGSTYPYHCDLRDRNLRIAPTFPSLAELEVAGRILCVCIKLCSLEKLLQEKNEA